MGKSKLGVKMRKSFLFFIILYPVAMHGVNQPLEPEGTHNLRDLPELFSFRHIQEVVSIPVSTNGSPVTNSLQSSPNGSPHTTPQHKDQAHAISAKVESLRTKNQKVKDQINKGSTAAEILGFKSNQPLTKKLILTAYNKRLIYCLPNTPERERLDRAKNIANGQVDRKSFHLPPIQHRPQPPKNSQRRPSHSRPWR